MRGYAHEDDDEDGDEEDEEARVFKWTGKNEYVALCDQSGVGFGGGYVLLPSHFFAFTYWLIKYTEKATMHSTSIRRF